MQVRVNLLKKSPKWSEYKHINNEYLCDIVQKTLFEHDQKIMLDIIEVTVVLANNKLMQDLNNKFMSKNQPTNILSFPEQNFEGGNLESFATNGYINLGDVVLGHDIIKSESVEQDKKFIDHLTHLVVHGILHLLGYDHVDDKDALQMEAFEVKILNQLAIASPY